MATPAGVTEGTGGPPVRRSRRPAGWVRPALLVLAVGLVAVVAAAVGLPDVARLRAGVAGLGPAGPLAFALLYAAVTLTPLPKTVLSAAAGVLFGLLTGVAVVLAGALLGAVAAFALARALGRDTVERLTGSRVARLDALLGRRGLPAVLAVRLVPVLPFTAVNYLAGLTAVRFRDYLAGTALGIVPGTVAFVTLGAHGSSPGSWPFVLAVLALVALSAGGAAAARRLRRPPNPRREESPCPSPPPTS
ncbi:VTT domain-containing protein [Geodermatophilus sp. DSM 44513]|uniref:TVP38/TMEM64 family protein n=1 Tax=Geodermatophilus sp. DSM 44513 TaxID=1528104 RepID=UPI0028F6E3F8|nr:VTT domain-containing protein [Geodermatophilus sp. DSM 44513]WNV77698.1 VTT domain-containing protein [Geodermatophilus sp. DSM 44513]